MVRSCERSLSSLLFSFVPRLCLQPVRRWRGELQREAVQRGDQHCHRHDPLAPRNHDKGVFQVFKLTTRLIPGVDEAFPRGGTRHNRSPVPLPGGEVRPWHHLFFSTYQPRFAGEGLDEATGESLSSHPIYLCRTIIDFEHRLYRFLKHVTCP